MEVNEPADALGARNSTVVVTNSPRITKVRLSDTRDLSMSLLIILAAAIASAVKRKRVAFRNGIDSSAPFAQKFVAYQMRICCNEDAHLSFSSPQVHVVTGTTMQLYPYSKNAVVARGQRVFRLRITVIPPVRVGHIRVKPLLHGR